MVECVMFLKQNDDVAKRISDQSVRFYEEQLSPERRVTRFVTSLCRTDLSQFTFGTRIKRTGASS